MNLFTYLKETVAELKEVVFPGVSQTVVYTVLVIVLSIVVAALLAVSDIGLQKLIAKLVLR